MKVIGTFPPTRSRAASARTDRVLVRTGGPPRNRPNTTKVCEEIGCAVVFGGDPRGYTVKLILPSRLSNHWGGETFGVPQ